MTLLATRSHSEPSAVEFDKLIPYSRFLERRAWRQIADDFCRLENESIQIQPLLKQALAVDVPPEH
jgi:hypothetical protein